MLKFFRDNFSSGRNILNTDSPDSSSKKDEVSHLIIKEDQPLPDTIDDEQKTNIASRRKIPYRIFTTSSVFIVNILYMVFLYVAIRSALNSLSEEFNVNTKYFDWLFVTAAGLLSAANTACDITVTNPIEDADNLALNKQNIDENLDELSDYKIKAVKTLSSTNFVLSTANNVINAGANAVSIAYLSSYPSVRWGIGVPITALGLVYLHLLITPRISRHAYEFIRSFFSCNDSIIINAARKPLDSLEVTIQSLSSAVYRGIATGYVMAQLLTNFFNINNEDEPLDFYCIVITAAISFYVALFSRTLNVHKQFFNKEFDKITFETLKNTNISRLGIFADCLMSLLRTIPAAALVYKYIPSTYGTKLLAASTTGMLIGTHSFWIRYKNRLYKTTLDRINTSSLVQSTPQSGIAPNSVQIFNSIKEQFKTNNLKRAITALNISARIAQSLAFFGFLTTLNQALSARYSNSILGFYEVLCLHQLWGNTTLENDASFYQNNLVDSWAYIRTKKHIEKTVPKFGYWGSFWKTKNEYPKNYLESVIAMKNSDEKIDSDNVSDEQPVTLEQSFNVIEDLIPSSSLTAVRN